MEFFPIILICVGIAFVVFVTLQKSRAVKSAKTAYEASLSRLAHKPTDAGLKMLTLDLGRTYSKLTRDKKGNTLFDEVALMNDINAACAAASVTTPAASPESPSGKSAEERLRTLADLKVKGLLEHEDYEKRRAEILRSI